MSAWLPHSHHSQRSIRSVIRKFFHKNREFPEKFHVSVKKPLKTGFERAAIIFNTNFNYTARIKKWKFFYAPRHRKKSEIEDNTIEVYQISGRVSQKWGQRSQRWIVIAPSLFSEKYSIMNSITPISCWETCRCDARISNVVGCIEFSGQMLHRGAL